jgi:hypothetical protein
MATAISDQRASLRRSWPRPRHGPSSSSGRSAPIGSTTASVASLCRRVEGGTPVAVIATGKITIGQSPDYYRSYW